MDRNGFRVVPATERNVAVIGDFIAALAREHRMKAKIDEGRLQECLFGPTRTAEAFIGYQQNEPISYALFFEDFSSFTGETGLYLEDLYVRPEARCVGIGRKMLQHLAKLAVERGHRRIRWCSLRSNDAAKQFYERQGATPLTELLLFQLAGERLTSITSQ